MNLHPVVVLTSVTVGSALFNLVGAFLAVPAAAMFAVAYRYFQDMMKLKSGEKTAEELHFATVAASSSVATPRSRANISAPSG